MRLIKAFLSLIKASIIDRLKDALGRLERALRDCGAGRIAVVSVMGAFRTGKEIRSLVKTRIKIEVRVFP